MPRHRFPFLVGSERILTARLLDDRRTLAGLDSDPTIVQLEPGCALVPGFISVKLTRPRERCEFILGEMIDGKPRTTTYVETLLDLSAPGVVTMNSSIPFRIIRGKNRVHLHVPEGMGVVPALIIAKSPNRGSWRHLIVGDVWRGKPWLHSVKEAAIPRRDRPRRSRVEQ